MTTVIVGEAMLEYHSHGGAGLRYGGDTLNTAIHLARAGHEVAYVTAVGTDAISDALVDAWSAEGIDTRFVLRHPMRHPGIYAIHLDKCGERNFLYWRERSAARDAFSLPGIDDAMAFARSAKLLYFSLISLAVIDPTGCARLLDVAAARKSEGLEVAYDSNYRPKLWDAVSLSRSTSHQAMKSCTIGLPTNSDERELWDEDLSEIAIANCWKEAGASIVAVKAAEKGCVLSAPGFQSPGQVDAVPTKVVDSSGAGDAFNGGFLNAWLRGEEPRECVQSGQALARTTLGHQGAIEL